jgi:hypothetical protein
MSSPVMLRSATPPTKCQIELQNVRPPTAPTLRACPAGSSEVKILHLAACREGRTPLDLCSAGGRFWPDSEATLAAGGVRSLGSTCRRSVGPSPPLVTQSGLQWSNCFALRDSYSITSLAVASSVAGIVRPSTLAVLRLMTSSSLVACYPHRAAPSVPHQPRFRALALFGRRSAWLAS